MHSNNTTTPWEQTKNSFKSFMDKAKKNTNRVIPTFKARVEDLPESLAGLKTNVNKAVSGVRTNAESLSKLLKDKFQDTGKTPVNVKTKRKYEVEDLPKFFKDKSKEIGKVFSDEVVEISTIRSRSVVSDTQEFSFKLRLLTAADEDVSNITLPKMQYLIGFFKIYLLQEKNFTANIKVPKESEKLYNNYHKANKTVEEFISNAPIQILLQGIKITLQTDVKNINLGSLQQIEIFLNKQLKHVEKAKSEEQSQDTLQIEETENKNENVIEKRNTQDKQIVQGSFGYNIASNRKQITRAPVIVAAMHENISWFRSLFQPFNFFNTAQFFFPQLPKFSIQSNNMPPGVIPVLDQKEKEPVLDTRITEGSIGNLVPQETERDIGQTRSHTDYFKANRKKKSKKQAKELSKEEKQSTIKQAQIDARIAIIDNQIECREKKLDEIFIEVINGYKNQDPETFRNIFNSVFNIAYFQDKQLHEVLEPDEISEVLEVLKRPQPPHNSLLGKEYLQKQVYRKKEQLIKLVSGQPSPQPKNVSHEILPSKAVDHLPKTNEAKTRLPTNIRLKSPLKAMFSSKETYFCLFLVAASISALCLWHLPLGKVSVLKELVSTKKRESIGLTLNIGLPILITLCVLNLAYFLYSEYSVEQISEKDPPSRT
ncbi:hypothetical protein EJB00_01400 [Wolbachia endosymbiont of Drosophila mauritiana]|uniref:hypothetical protein n=1 Tax=unclassified Wolbachia TaxID=2640676 RepID=UPI00107E6C07|nr:MULTISPECIES: hypothetical protein [unclassified Wolbachia]QCB62326.1 hypothetical protein EJA99_01400 [Wolbachia endosymbiont of Drosophila mauritiana]QCB63373.1 hypothetical protein EJB00_01400 [Wolbachia endosymbiont of Drosophila mauritiana]QWE33363.1 Uncharacterized protein WwMa_04530 [Wolbachia endosymbiont of Drosophila simulans]TGB06579.1 hypothetical protein E5C28_03440 [Wolbachia endosymbiont of Drosophila mauritiana]